MGVKGLWRLLLPIGRRISIETLEGKILAIDASIWLTQFLKAMRDPDTGSVRPGAHLIGFFRRLAKLRWHGIRPVLVFDGPTPIIKLRELAQRRKRREQLSAKAAAGTMQRLAKQLLMKQLKKQQNSKDHQKPHATQAKAKASAISDGFNLPEDEQHLQQNIDNNNDGNGVEIVEIDHDADEKIKETSEEIARALQEEEWDKDEEEQAQPVQNDWDAFELESETGNDESKKQSALTGHLGDVDLSRIASLDPNARKIAIENAKRQQRIRSRREFMPVAGHASEFSSVQIKNFLRSARFNHNITKIAKKAVEKEDTESGQRMASDATTRIIFEKFDPNKDKKGPRRSLFSRRRADEDSDSELEWQSEAEESDINVEDEEELVTTKQESTRTNPVRAARKNRVTISDAASIDSDSGSGGGFFPSGEKDCDHDQDSPSENENDKKPEAREDQVGGDKPAENLHDESKFHDFNDGGGFIPTSRDPSEDKIHTHKSEVIPLIVHQDSDSDEDEGGDNEKQTEKMNEPNAQNEITQNHSRKSKAGSKVLDKFAVKNNSVDQDDRIGSEKKLGLPQNYQDRTQLVEDELLARAIQASEQDCEETAEEESEVVVVEDKSTNNAVVPNCHGKENMGIDVDLTLGDEKEGESNDDVMWEDGESTDNDKNTSDKQEGRKSDDNQQEEDSEASVVWEDGEGDDSIGDESRSETKPSIEMSDAHDNDFESATLPDENAVALERAQATAANLTNWAGRAFRRAIARHAEETGKPLSPSKSPRKQQTLGKINSLQESPIGPLGTKETVKEVRPSDNTPNTEELVDLTGAGKEQREPHHNRLGSHHPMNLTQSEETEALIEELNTEVTEEEKRHERDMDTITDEMKADVIKMIELFGIPYVESPAEAEAQCATLEELGLVDGIVTEDSDVFVFGGRNVYKNIFDDQKYVEAYLAEDAERDLALGRNHMVALAMLLGGDYTEGVKGVGIVNGMEILQVFDVSKDVKDGLVDFRKWLEGFDPADALGSNPDADALSVEQRFHAKHRSARSRWIPPKHFPAPDVLNAYTNPVTDKSTNRFSWGVPDLNRLIDFGSRNMGWEAAEVKNMIAPIVQRIEGGMRQTRLESFFMKYEDDIKFADVKSKRLRDVFRENRSKSRNQENVDASRQETRKRSKRRRVGVSEDSI